MSNQFKLTAITVKNAKSGMYSDSAHGLYLQVKATGAKSWIFRFNLHGKRKEMGLGGITALSLSEARKVAQELYVKVKNDTSYNPIIERKKKTERQRIEDQQKETTFEWCATQYIVANKTSWSNPKHRQQWTNTLTTYVYPFIGDMNIKDIELDHVLEVLTPIWYDKTETASRVRGRMEKVFAWATVHKYRIGNPALWKSNLEMVLPAPSKLKDVTHFASLPYDDIQQFMLDIRKKHCISAYALEFLILTAARTHNIMGAQWEQIDFENELWIIQRTDMKIKTSIHIVPLCSRCIKILKDLEQTRSSEYVFEGNSRTHGGLSNNAMDNFLQENMKYKKITVHGFRSTFKDWASELTDHSNEVSEMGLAHIIKNKAEAAYRRGHLMDKRRKMMEDWEAYCYPKGIN